MSDNVDTSLKNTIAYRKRQDAIVAAWRTWLHEIIASMEVQRQKEPPISEMIVSSELSALLNELGECDTFRRVLMHREQFDQS
jgi:hypothetical protein